MKPPEKDKWLDEVISRMAAVDKPAPNFEKWRQDHPKAVEALKLQAKPTSLPKNFWYRVAGIAAIAASIILVFTLPSINIWNKNGNAEIETSPYYILAEFQKNYLQETKPCDILPPLPN